jgi:hypothetical protein
MTHFDTFSFDETERTLWRGQQVVPMTRKAREVLACLVEARGLFVSKAEILARVWPDTYVVPENIKVLVREIRRALHDDSHNPQFIRSEAGRGYAFIASPLDRPVPLPAPSWSGGDLAALAEGLEALARLARSLNGTGGATRPRYVAARLVHSSRKSA